MGVNILHGGCDYEMVTYIRLESLRDQAEAESVGRFRELWEENGCAGLAPPVRSLPIRLWALLHGGSFTADEIAERLACRPRSAYVAVQRLRDAGQMIENRRSGYGPGKFCLVEGPPLVVVESRDGIRLPRSGSRRSRGEVMIELK